MVKARYAPNPSFCAVVAMAASMEQAQRNNNFMTSIPERATCGGVKRAFFLNIKIFGIYQIIEGGHEEGRVRETRPFQL